MRFGNTGAVLTDLLRFLEGAALVLGVRLESDFHSGALMYLGEFS